MILRTLYVTSHMFLDNMTSIFVLLLNDLACMKYMGMLTKMNRKIDMYFEYIEIVNILLYIETILDPTNKASYMDTLLLDVY